MPGLMELAFPGVLPAFPGVPDTPGVPAVAMASAVAVPSFWDIANCVCSASTVAVPGSRDAATLGVALANTTTSVSVAVGAGVSVGGNVAVTAAACWVNMAFAAIAVLVAAFASEVAWALALFIGRKYRA